MIRSWQIGIIFGLCLVLVLAAMGWVTWTALKLDLAQTQARQAEAQARRQAAFEEDVRLALWRMDSALAPLIAQENSRPYFAWNSFYPAERAYANMLSTARQGELLVPSPLLSQESPYVLLYFQLEPTGQLTSPQVPRENVKVLARAYVDASKSVLYAGRLRSIDSRLDRRELLAVLPPEPVRPVEQIAIADNAFRGEGDRGGKGFSKVQSKLSAAEYEARMRSVQQAAQVAQMSNNQLSNEPYAQQQSLSPSQQGRFSQAPASAPVLQQSPQSRADDRSEDPYHSGDGGEDPYHTDPFTERQSPSGLSFVQQSLHGGEVAVGMMKPFWTGDMLILARHVQTAGRSYVQGCWLDWPAIQQWLLASVQDILPHARLEPVSDSDSQNQHSRMLAALPVRLLPGDAPVASTQSQPAGVAAESPRLLTPIRISLLLAWVCVLLAAGAVVMLLVGTLSLSERRATFVSSVTHELRTPLTTLRMYTEMLAGGMVPDDAKRRRYFDTLQREADRLGHLVENVLAYARLERGGKRKRVETLNLRQLLDRASERLTSRCAQGAMQLSVNLPDWADRACVRADLSAVEQILFNLVDNACKYAAGRANPCIQVTIDTDGQWAFVRVRDFGPGIDSKAARRLFRPFSKSDKDAAASAPGIGLGLALSRRLAREMRGDLRLDPRIGDGAGFVLSLPMVQCCEDCQDQAAAKEV